MQEGVCRFISSFGVAGRWTCPGDVAQAVEMRISVYL